MSFVPTQTIGNYEIIGIIDKPKAGVTYKVRNLTTHNFETLRALPGASGDPESVERFLREIKVHTRLSHPNIVSFYDALQLDGQLVMTAEFVEGMSLTQRFRQGPMPLPEAIRQICDLLSALEEAHALGIVHRSITPDNIILTGGGTIKLGGFGLAKPVSDMNLTQAGAVLGDPKYISPEQVAKPTAVDRRADLYSVGVLLYEALTGKTPFDGRNDYEIMVAHVTAQPAAPSTRNPEVSPELDGITLKALAKDPTNRFQSAAEFRDALKASAPAEPEVSAQPATPSAPSFGGITDKRDAGWRSKKALVLSAAGTVIGLAVIILLAMHKL